MAARSRYQNGLVTSIISPSGGKRVPDCSKIKLGEGKIDVVVKLKREQRKKDDKALTVLQIKVIMF